MKKIILTAALITLIPVSANAADDTFVLDKDLCKYIIAYHPTKDGDVEYKPGVDVKGKPVVKADINPEATIEIPESISFPLTIEMAKYIGMEIPAGVKTGETNLGYVEVREDGAVLFNGKPLGGEAENTLKSLCTKGEGKNLGEEDKKINQ